MQSLSNLIIPNNVFGDRSCLLLNPTSHFLTVNTTLSSLFTYIIHQVFQKVQVSIKVKEGRAGARRLVIGLVFDGVDYAEDSGQSCLNCFRYKSHDHIYSF